MRVNLNTAQEPNTAVARVRLPQGEAPCQGMRLASPAGSGEEAVLGLLLRHCTH